MEDVAPQLVENVTGEFRRLYDASGKIKGLLAKVKAKTATYAEAQEYAIEVSRLIGQAWAKCVTPDTLPEGRMYYNIAARLVPAALDENHELVAGYAAEVQKGLNDRAGIGLKVQRAEQDRDRVKGLVELACSTEQYEDTESRLLSAFENFSQHIVDETIRRNAELHHNAGLRPKIIRRSTGKCCRWCQALAGTYDYPDVDRDVYRRHDHCRCTVLYDPADGSKSVQNVHTRRWTNEKDYAKLKEKESPQYQRPTTTKVRNSELPNGLPIKGVSGAVVDKTDDFGKVLQRRIYGADGKAETDYDTSDHGIRILHPTGAHKHIFDYSKKNPHGPPLQLDDTELEENRDIIQRGVNYHDPK